MHVLSWSGGRAAARASRELQQPRQHASTELRESADRRIVWRVVGQARRPVRQLSVSKDLARHALRRVADAADGYRHSCATRTMRADTRARLDRARRTERLAACALLA